MWQIEVTEPNHHTDTSRLNSEKGHKTLRTHTKTAQTTDIAHLLKGTLRDGVAGPKKLGRRKDVDSISRLAQTATKHENLLREVTETGLEQGEPLQGALDIEDEGRQRQATQHKVRVDDLLDSNLHKPLAKKIRLGQSSQAGAVSRERMLMKNDSCVLRDKSAGGEGPPEHCGLRGGGKLSSPARIYSTYEPKGSGSNHEMRSCKPPTDKARVTPSSEIEKGLQQSIPRSKGVKEAAPAKSIDPTGKALAAPAEPGGMAAKASTADGDNKNVIQEVIITGDINGLVLRSAADDAMIRALANHEESQQSSASQEEKDVDCNQGAEGRIKRRAA